MVTRQQVEQLLEGYVQGRTKLSVLRKQMLAWFVERKLSPDAKRLLGRAEALHTHMVDGYLSSDPLSNEVALRRHLDQLLHPGTPTTDRECSIVYFRPVSQPFKVSFSGGAFVSAGTSSPAPMCVPVGPRSL